MSKQVLNVTTDQIRTILSIAQNLQKQYDILGAPTTQNVRNPYPLHKLIVGVLPTRKSEAMDAAQIHETLTGYGYRVPFYSLQMTLAKMKASGLLYSRVSKIHTGNRPHLEYAFCS